MRRTRMAFLVPALLALAACSLPLSESGEPLPVGTVLDDLGSAAGEHVVVNIPTGRLDFTVGKPIDELPISHDTYSHAADGASIVGVTWNWDFQSAFDSMAVGRTSAVEPHVSLVADGRDYSLDEAMLSSLDEDPVTSSDAALDFFGTAWVGVAGEPEEFAIRVEFDGVEQVVEVGGDDNVDGPAAALYYAPDQLALRTFACAPPRAGRRVLSEGNGVCQVETARVPYHPAVGWVATQRASWLVVRTRLMPDLFRIASYKCGTGELGEVTFRLGEAKPVVVERVDPDDVILRRELVIFDTDGAGGPDELVMRANVTFPRGYCAPKKLTWRTQIF